MIIFKNIKTCKKIVSPRWSLFGQREIDSNLKRARCVRESGSLGVQESKIMNCNFTRDRLTAVLTDARLNHEIKNQHQIPYCAWPVVTPSSLNQDWLLGSSWQPDCWLIRASQGYQCCSWLMIRARPASLARISAQDVDKDHQHYSRFYNRSVLINGEITPGSRWRSWRMR